jgi:hypothetical protein
MRIAPAPRQPVSKKANPGRDPRSCCDGQAAISVHADETVAVDEDDASADARWALTALLHPRKAGVAPRLSPSMQRDTPIAVRRGPIARCSYRLLAALGVALATLARSARGIARDGGTVPRYVRHIWPCSV